MKLKRFIAAVLAAAFSTVGFTGYTPVMNNRVYAAAAFNITKSGGWYEYAFAEADRSISKAYYKIEGTSTYTQADTELIRGNRVDIPGLKGNTAYIIKVESADGAVAEAKVTTMSYIREGYAHYNASNIGAYNDDGTLKSGAKVIYVTNENKNTVKLGKYTGIGNILSNASKITTPLAVRFIGKVDTQAWDSDGTKTTDKAAGIVAINGLTDRELTDDSYFNMCDMSQPANLTLEGIGTDANIEKWGFTIKGGQGVEIRNLSFDKYPEDAIGMQDTSSVYSKNIWIHNNHFDRGENKYDRTTEKDKGEGDGTTDIKYSEYITVSDNYYTLCHKTSLIGGGTSHKQDYITFARNYFYKTSSRTPRVRNAHVHVYNNYYQGVTGYGVGASYNSKIFTENNYFENSKNPIDMGPIGSDKYSGTVKSFGDEIVNCTEKGLGSKPVIASSRDRIMNIPNGRSGGDAYDNFDTDSSKFYYNKYTALSAADAKAQVVDYSGVIGLDSKYNEGSVISATTSTSTTTTTTTTESTTEATTSSTTTTESQGEEPITEATTISDYAYIPSKTTTFSAGEAVYTCPRGDIVAYQKIGVSADEQTIDNVNYKYCCSSTGVNQKIDLGGGTKTHRIAFKITAKEDSQATVVLKVNSGSSTKYAYLLTGTAPAIGDTSTVGNMSVVKEYANSSGSVQYITFKADFKKGQDYYITGQGINPGIYAVYFNAVLGDINKDGAVNRADAAMVLKHIADIKALSEDELSRADVNRDNKYDMLDVLKILGA